MHTQVTLNHLSWTVIVISSCRGDDLCLREREVLSCHKLSKDANGMSKTGVKVGGANADAVSDLGVPVSNIDYYCTDTTSYASSLNLPRKLGGDEPGVYMWPHRLPCPSAVY